jgi:peroxin-1
MPSKRKLAPVVSRDGINSNTSAREQEISSIEIDTTFARVLGLTEGQKVGDCRTYSERLGTDYAGRIIPTS